MRNLWITALPIAALLLTACGGPTVGQAAPAPKTSTGQTKPVSSTARPCRAADMKALPTIPAPPQQPGTESVRVTLNNFGDDACTIGGPPQAVAISDQAGSSTRRNLAVTPSGKDDPLTLQPGDTVSAFVSSAETDDFTCASGAEPTRAPVLLVGVPTELVSVPMVPGSSFTECGDAVTVTPWQAFG